MRLASSLVSSLANRCLIDPPQKVHVAFMSLLAHENNLLS